MTTVENGLFVQVAYKGTLGNGEVFDTSEGRAPLEVHMGEGQMIPGFEAALMGMAVNEKKTFTLEPDDAYGHRNDELTHTFQRSEIPPEATPETGQTILLSTPDGRQVPAQVIEVTDEKVVVDLNHPLADQSLTFDIEIVGITDAPTQQPVGGCDCGCDQTQCGSGCEGGQCS